MNLILRFSLCFVCLSLLNACGSTPKDVDRDGLRERADQETSQVK